MRGFKVITLGCKVSRYDGELIRQNLMGAGWREDDDLPDVIFLQGCAVTRRAERKAAQVVRKIRRRLPDAAVVISGCLAKMLTEQSDAVASLPDGLLVWEDGIRWLSARKSDGVLPDGVRRWGKLDGFLSRPLVKIQDGCDRRCTYCIVPHLRGNSVSRPLNDVVEQVRLLSEMGYPEVVITGVHIGLYRSGDAGLAALLRLLLDKTSIPQIRLSSIEPNELDDELFELLVGESRIAHYFHIPMQSGSERVITRMGRSYSPVDIEVLFERFSAVIPDVGLGTDIIVGFPGESDADFENTYSLLKHLPLSNIHLFRYSPRPMTPAADYSDQVSSNIVSSRMERLSELRLDKIRSFAARFINRPQRYILDGVEHDGYLTGISSNYVHCKVKNDIAAKGGFIELIGESVAEEHLLCVPAVSI